LFYKYYNLSEKMNQSEPLISNKYILDESRIDEYIQKKNVLMYKRGKKAWQSIIFTIIITILYYLDIGTDLNLCQKYYVNGDVWWFRITLGIVIISSLLNTCILLKYSYLQEFKFNWKKKQCPRIIIKSFCLLFQLEMLLW
jgi:uncharacterized integral membrane protein